MDKMIHIGKEIRKRIITIGMTNAEFARRMNRSPQAVQWWLKKETIDTGLLEKIGDVLEYNFFICYLASEEVNKVQEDSSVYKTKQKLEKKLTEIKGQLDDCEKEKKYLKEINHLLKNK